MELYAFTLQQNVPGYCWSQMAHASVLVALLNDKTAFKTPNLVGSHSYAAQKRKNHTLAPSAKVEDVSY